MTDHEIYYLMVGVDLKSVKITLTFNRNFMGSFWEWTRDGSKLAIKEGY